MGLFNDDVVSLPEINADTIREVTTFAFNDRRSHQEIAEIINNIVHSIYYNAKIGVYPSDGTWEFEGRIFGIPVAYATGYMPHTPPPPSFKKMLDDTEDTLKYIENIFVQLGFEFEYVKADKDIVNAIRIRIPFKTQSFESFAQTVYSKTIAADLVPVVPMDAPSKLPAFMFMDPFITKPKKPFKKPFINTRNKLHKRK